MFPYIELPWELLVGPLVVFYLCLLYNAIQYLVHFLNFLFRFHVVLLYVMIGTAQASLKSQ